MKSLILLGLAFAIVLSHPTHYPLVDEKSCFLPEPAKIYSWHIHLIYWQTHEEHRQGAYKVRQHLFEHFNLTQGPVCVDLFHQNYTCTFEPEDDPAGPFVTGQWSIFLIPEDFEEYVTWITQNREGYDILIHPNSGCEIQDHTTWALWAGHPWQIDPKAFSHDDPFPWADDAKSSMIVIPNSQNDHQIVSKFLEERRL